MAELTAVPKRIGGSIAVFIPADIAKAEGIQEGKPVHITVRAIHRRAEVFGRLRGLNARFQRRREGDWPDR